MAGPNEGGGPEGTNDRGETPPPLTKEQIKGHVSALKSLIKSYNRKNRGDLIRLDFEIEDTEAQEYKMPTNIKLYDGTTDPKDHLSRFARSANSREWLMPVWCRMFQQTLDESAKGWFKRLPHENINEWAELRDAFATRYSVRRACFKEPCEITKIIRRANDSLTAFKERWTVETCFIMGVPEVMKISSFMDSIKSPELAKRFSDKVPITVNEVMERLDDFVLSEAAYANTELPKGETGETHHKASLPINGRDVLPFRSTRPRESRMDDFRNSHRGRDAYYVNKARDDRAPYPPPRGEYNSRVAPLRLPVPRPMLNPLRSGNTDRYCDYHQEKGHYTNDCIQLRKQLEMTLESGKLNHLVKDVRQRGRGSHGRDDPQPAKIINVISVNSVKDKKRKVKERPESLDNIHIFPAISSEDISEEPLIVEAVVEGYLVRRVYVDEGSSVEVMFEHCFENLNPKIKARRTSMKFIVVRAPSPYNIILGRPELKTLRAVPSTIHSMMKFPTPKGIVTLVTRTVIIAECRRLEKKQMVEEENPKGKGEVAVTEEVLVNPLFPDQLVTIGGGLLVDSTFQPQIGRNLEAYVDGMVIKSRDEKMLLGDIAETFDNLKKINMKLNPKKCSFGVKEGKLLGYMVTSEGIRANLRKMKALADLQSPRTLKEMQSLSGNLAALNRFLVKSAERSLPFFNTLKT
ncbi:reverse transcriptase domain-containing protein [Tanacetum coccineum]